MSTLAERAEAQAVDVSCTDDTLTVVLSDGRVISAPLAWFPRLLDATAKQRRGRGVSGGRASGACGWQRRGPGGAVARAPRRSGRLRGPARGWSRRFLRHPRVP